MAISNGRPELNHVLFVLCSAGQAELERPCIQLICNGLKLHGVAFSALTWDSSLLTSPDYIQSRFTHITFLTADGCHKQILKFWQLIRTGILPAANPCRSLKVFNSPEFVLWNSNKTYLLDLKAAGFLVSPTRVLPADSSEFDIQHTLAAALPGTSCVLKPSITAGGLSTHLVKNPYQLTADDNKFIQTFVVSARQDSLLVQDYEPEIVNGEMMIMYVNGKITHATLKTPAIGEFRTSTKNGAARKQVRVADLPASAIKTVERLMAWLNDRFGKIAYARIDGIPKKDGSFVLIEVEGIEPYMGFEKATPENDEPNQGLQEFIKLFLEN